MFGAKIMRGILKTNPALHGLAAAGRLHMACSMRLAVSICAIEAQGVSSMTMCPTPLRALGMELASAEISTEGNGATVPGDGKQQPIRPGSSGLSRLNLSVERKLYIFGYVSSSQG